MSRILSIGRMTKKLLYGSKEHFPVVMKASFRFLIMFSLRSTSSICTPTREIYCDFINQLQGPLTIWQHLKESMQLGSVPEGTCDRRPNGLSWQVQTNLHVYWTTPADGTSSSITTAKECWCTASNWSWVMPKTAAVRVRFDNEPDWRWITHRWLYPARQIMPLHHAPTSHAPTWAPVFRQLLTTALGDKGTVTLEAKTHASSCGAACVKDNINWEFRGVPHKMGRDLILQQMMRARRRTTNQERRGWRQEAWQPGCHRSAPSFQERHPAAQRNLDWRMGKQCLLSVLLVHSESVRDPVTLLRCDTFAKVAFAEMH